MSNIHNGASLPKQLADFSGRFFVQKSSILGIWQGPKNLSVFSVDQEFEDNWDVVQIHEDRLRLVKQVRYHCRKSADLRKTY